MADFFFALQQWGYMYALQHNCVFLGAGGMQSCVTGYSIYGRKIFFLLFFFCSLRYTLINLLKAATPVSSSLTHLKRQTALNPSRIFSMDASEKKNGPALQLTAFCHRV